MSAVERLRRDHKILRAKLDVLDAALRMEPETWYVLREVCFTLARQLNDHIRREDDLVAACRKAMIPPPPHSSGSGGMIPPPPQSSGSGGMNPKVLAEVVIEHHDEPEHLRTINRLFVSEEGHSMARIRPALEAIITGLRHHMAEEEAELFPILERVLGEPAAQAPARVASPAHLEEGMTVNRVVQEFPKARPVFERLFVNVPMEGCNCLDEVAWRHGMESRELLGALEGAIAPRRHGNGAPAADAGSGVA